MYEEVPSRREAPRCYSRAISQVATVDAASRRALRAGCPGGLAMTLIKINIHRLLAS